MNVITTRSYCTPKAIAAKAKARITKAKPHIALFRNDRGQIKTAIVRGSRSLGRAIAHCHNWLDSEREAKRRDCFLISIDGVALATVSADNMRLPLPMRVALRECHREQQAFEKNEPCPWPWDRIWAS